MPVGLLILIVLTALALYFDQGTSDLDQDRPQDSSAKSSMPVAPGSPANQDGYSR
jgi:hypothetical protein